MAFEKKENNGTIEPLSRLPKVKSTTSFSQFNVLSNITHSASISVKPTADRHKTHFWELTDETKRKDDMVLGRRGGYVFLALTIFLMMAAIMLISTSLHISSVKPCELKTALDSIHLKYTPHPCKYNAIKEMGIVLWILGSADLFWNLIFFLVVLRICMWESKLKKLGFTILYIVLGIVALIFLITNLIMYLQVVYKIKQQTDIDYVDLQSAMKTWLDKKYASDNVTSEFEISNAWNLFFLQYDCCAVREVIGTTNDFDNTSWCTTSGSCQATASQIPKTCCKSVTMEDYQSAPSECHASVNMGTFKPSCIGRMRALSYVNIDECQVFFLSFSLFILMALQLLEVGLVLLIFLIICIHWTRTNRRVGVQQPSTINSKQQKLS